jgi:zinc protease
MRNASKAIAVLALLGLSILPLRGGQDPAGPAGSTALPFRFKEYRLKNGLRVVLSEDRSLPLVTVAVGYGAGTLREKPGQEGLAYLLENLMFQGSENVSPLQHISFIQKIGGELNATTTAEKALFYETLPSNQLALALWLESDRMRSLVITPAAIERTRADLLKEHGERLAGDAYYATFSFFDSLLFPDDLYGRPLISLGMNDLTEAEVEAFYRTYYVPSNAILCIIGHIDEARTRELVARYFESIPGGQSVPLPPPPDFRREADAVVRFSPVAATGAGFHMGFRFFPLTASELNCLRLLQFVLLEGETSRLRSRLLHRDLTASYLSGAIDERPHIATLKLFCLATNDILVARSEKAILSEIDRIKSNPPSQEDMAKAWRRFKTDYLNRLSTDLGRARFIIDAHFRGRPLDTLEHDLADVKGVSAASLAAFTAKFFTPQNRVVLEFGPK